MNCLKLINHTHRQLMFKICSVNYVSQHPMRFLEAQDRWKQKDGMSRRWDLIYKAPMDNVLNYLTSFITVTTTTIAFGTVYYAACIFDINKMNEPVLLGDDVVIANNSMECLIYLGAFIAFNIAIKILLSKYVIRLYKNGDNYIAIFRGHWYNQIKKHEFHLNQFKKLKPAFVVTWSDARYDLGKKHGILLDEYFKTPEYLNYLLLKKKSNSISDD